MTVGHDAALMDRVRGHRIIRGKVVSVRSPVEAGVLRLYQPVDPEELHVAIDRAPHLLAEDQEVPIRRNAVRFAGDQVSVADVVADIVRHAEVDIIDTLRPGRDQRSPQA